MTVRDRQGFGLRPEKGLPTEATPPLRVALLTYRGNPYCGGQGVYVRHLSRELVRLGHQVDVISGPPYPHLDQGVRLVEIASLDLYREPDPFRMPRLGEFRDWVDALEVGVMMTAGFPEPLTFSLRALRQLRTLSRRLRHRPRQPEPGVRPAGLPRLGLPLVTDRTIRSRWTGSWNWPVRRVAAAVRPPLVRRSPGCRPGWGPAASGDHRLVHQRTSRSSTIWGCRRERIRRGAHRCRHDVVRTRIRRWSARPARWSRRPARTSRSRACCR